MELENLITYGPAETLQFFYIELSDLTEGRNIQQPEILYNASLLAHFVSTSTCSQDTFPATPSDLSQVFNLYVLDQSEHADSQIMEFAGAQCLLLTGFFAGQSRGRHNLAWFTTLGQRYYGLAARFDTDEKHRQMMQTMADRFHFWRRRYSSLAQQLRQNPYRLH